MIDPWPLHGLVLRTPRLELRPDDDEGLRRLGEAAQRGVHPPEEMPFSVPWTDADPQYLGRGAMQHFWGARSRLGPEEWEINFLVRLGGTVIGVQSLMGRQFAVRRIAETGSWIESAHQRQGVGTEMRCAVLMFAFDHLGAHTARSEAFDDNAASRGVFRKLGYRENGWDSVVRRGAPARMVRQILPADDLVRPAWDLEVEGLTDDLRGLLGAG